MMESNFSSVFYACKFPLAPMRRRGWDQIVNFGAVGTERAFGQAKIAAYSAALNLQWWPLVASWL